jgi:hypothetical protein
MLQPGGCHICRTDQMIRDGMLVEHREKGTIFRCEGSGQAAEITWGAPVVAFDKAGPDGSTTAAVIMSKNTEGEHRVEASYRGEEAERLAESLEAKREAIAVVEAHVNKSWRDTMREFVRQVAAEKDYFTADDAFDKLERIPPARRPITHDQRAFGAVMGWAVRQGLCAKSDRLPVPSRRVKLHAVPRTVWKSLIYEQPGLVDQVCPRCHQMQHNVGKTGAETIRLLGCEACRAGNQQ